MNQKQTGGTPCGQENEKEPLFIPVFQGFGAFNDYGGDAISRPRLDQFLPVRGFNDYGAKSCHCWAELPLSVYC